MTTGLDRLTPEQEALLPAPGSYELRRQREQADVIPRRRRLVEELDDADFEP